MTILPAGDREKDSPPFVSGPLTTDEIERLLRVVDERVRIHGNIQAPAYAPAGGADVLDPAATFEGESLRGLAAPLFHTGKGGRLVRAAKALLNLPLGVLGHPQAHFNAAMQRVVSSWADVLGATLDNLAALQHEVAAQRARLKALEARLARHERGEEDPPPS
jgi:hypothetical protein